MFIGATNVRGQTRGVTEVRTRGKYAVRPVKRGPIPLSLDMGSVMLVECDINKNPV